MKARPHRRDELAAVLMSGFEMLRWAGCTQYLVGLDVDDDDGVWVTEVWQSREQHDEAVRFDAARQVIARALTLMVGGFDGHEQAVVASWGNPDASPSFVVDDAFPRRHLYSV